MAFAERGRDGDVRDRRNVPARALIPLDVPALADLRQKRLHDCRLTPDRALQTLEEAEAFLVDRGVLTLTQDSALPSLFAASHEEPYKKGSPGFGSWPKTKYVWAFQLTERPGVLSLKVHRGKQLLCHQAAIRAIDPLARAALAEAEAAADDRARLVRHLKSAGPSQIDDVTAELGLEAPALRKIREQLEAAPPGTNFPEQPGTHVANACASVLANPGSGTGGAAGQNASPTALAITGAIVVDACFGGP